MESREAAERFERAEELAEARESFGKRTAALSLFVAGLCGLVFVGAGLGLVGLLSLLNGFLLFFKPGH